MNGKCAALFFATLMFAIAGLRQTSLATITPSKPVSSDNTQTAQEARARHGLFGTWINGRVVEAKGGRRDEYAVAVLLKITKENGGVRIQDNDSELGKSYPKKMNRDGSKDGKGKKVGSFGWRAA